MNPFAYIRAVTFDVGGTLIQPWPSVGHVYAEIAGRHGLKNLPIEKLNQQFAAAWRAKKNFQHTRQDWERIVDETFAGLCATPPSRTFFADLYERFARPSAWRVYEDVLPVLEALTTRQMRMAIISNWDERLRPLLGTLALDRYFETLVISCEVGASKPSSVIFSQAVERLGLPSSAILHVGDSWDEDVRGARAAGLRALHIERNKQAVDANSISSLNALMDSTVRSNQNP